MTLVFLLAVVGLFGQQGRPELGGFTYTLFPELSNTRIEKYDVRLNGGVKAGYGLVGFGLSYSNFNFIYDDRNIGFDLSSYEQMHVLRFSLRYLRPLKNDWNLNISASPVLSGNFKEGIVSEDFQYNGFAMLRKVWRKDESESNLSFGLAFGNFFGRPSLLPMASYGKIVNNKWGFTVGIPRMFVYYLPAERHRIQFTMGVEGLYGNNSSRSFIPDFGVLENTKLALASFSAGLEHQFEIQRGINTVVKAGYSYNQLAIEDNDTNELYDFDAGGSAFFSMGLNINLNIFKNEKTKN